MNLTTNYCGLELKHPLMAGASPLTSQLDGLKKLEDGGVSAATLHSLFEEQLTHQQLGMEAYIEGIEENYAESTSFFPSSLDFKLGPEQYLDFVEKAKAALDIPVIASINGKGMKAWLEYSKLIQQAGADALELNLYAVPTNVWDSGSDIEERGYKIAQMVKKELDIPVIVKLSPYYSSLSNLAKGLEERGVDGLVLFNRFLQPDIDLENLEMMPSLKLSDRSELPLRLRWCSILKGFLHKTHIAISGGVHEAEDVIKALMCGAETIQLVSALLQRGPHYTSELLDNVQTWIEEKEYESLDQLRGSMSYNRCGNPEVLERANYMKVLQSFKV
jgi:dihydroorotate dehydrogenase (fumarate)